MAASHESKFTIVKLGQLAYPMKHQQHKGLNFRKCKNLLPIFYFKKLIKTMANKEKEYQKIRQ